MNSSRGQAGRPSLGVASFPLAFRFLRSVFLSVSVDSTILCPVVPGGCCGPQPLTTPMSLPGLSYPVFKGIMKKGYKVPTPIQRKVRSSRAAVSSSCDSSP